MSSDNNYDVLIIGGGIVGLTLACALGGSRFKVGLVEANETNKTATVTIMICACLQSVELHSKFLLI